MRVGGGVPWRGAVVDAFTAVPFAGNPAGIVLLPPAADAAEPDEVTSPTFTLMHAQCGMLRERVLRAADASFGHRLMMDRVVPGGVSHDLPVDGAAHLQALLDAHPLVNQTDDVYSFL